MFARENIRGYDEFELLGRTAKWLCNVLYLIRLTCEGAGRANDMLRGYGSLYVRRLVVQVCKRSLEPAGHVDKRGLLEDIARQ